MENQLIKYMPTDKVRLCKKDICIEARGENARIIVVAVSIVLYSIVLHFKSIQVGMHLEKRLLCNDTLMTPFCCHSNKPMKGLRNDDVLKY